MRDGRRPIATIILGVAVVTLALLIIAGLAVSAARDSGAGAWLKRGTGFAVSIVALVIGSVMAARSRAQDAHYWTTVGMLAIASLYVGANSYRPPDPQVGDRAKAIPLSIGGWIGEDEPASEVTFKVLKTTDIIQRSYRRGTEQVGLAVVFAMGSRKVAHPPEQCYEADGFETDENANDSFTTADGRTVNVRRLIIFRSIGQKRADALQSEYGWQAVLYWYRAGDFNTPSFFWQQFYVILSNLNPLRRTGTRVALIRVNVGMRGSDEKARESALATLRNFSRDVFPEVEKALAGVDATAPRTSASGRKMHTN